MVLQSGLAKYQLPWVPTSAWPVIEVPRRPGIDGIVKLISNWFCAFVTPEVRVAAPGPLLRGVAALPVGAVVDGPDFPLVWPHL